MPENQKIDLPPRAQSSTRWSRKWATLGGCGTSTTVLSSDDSDHREGQRTSSTSLLRKSSTISRTHDTSTAPHDEISNPSLKKSCSLMNVLRAKLHSPTVLRRFRSKSRENSKAILNDDQQATATKHGEEENDEGKDLRRKKSFSIPKSTPMNDEEQPNAATRRSRKRDPSPMRRFANRLVQLTRHHTSIERKMPETKPSQSKVSDALDQGHSTQPTTHDRNEVEHINACYDEIRAKYFDSTTNKHAPPVSSVDNGMISDLKDRHLPLLPDDPLLQARKQANIKLNCMLSGYTLRSPFSTHERVFTDHHLFKFHHYYDVGKRKYDWTMTNENNRLFNSMRSTRPLSRSIDSFRQPMKNDFPPSAAVVEKVEATPVENATPVQTNETTDLMANAIEISAHRDDDDDDDDDEIARPSFIETELFIREDGDPIEPIVENRTAPAEEADEEFEKNFLRAVDRALGMVKKDSLDQNESISSRTEVPMDLTEMTELALASVENSSLLTNEQIESNVELTNELPQENAEDQSIDPAIQSLLNDLIDQIDGTRNGQEFLAKLDDEERIIKVKADTYQKLLNTDDNRLTEDVRTDINAVIGEVNLLLKGKLKQFRGLCQANVENSITPTGEPVPLDSDLEGFWDITYPLIDKVKEKFSKLDARRANQWAPIEEYDPNDINNRPRVIDDRLKQLQPQQNRSSKIPVAKTGNDDLKKLIQERRKAAAAHTANQNHEIEIFVGPK